MEDFWPPFIFQNKIILFNNFLFELKRFNTTSRSLHDLGAATLLHQATSASFDDGTLQK